MQTLWLFGGKIIYMQLNYAIVACKFVGDVDSLQVENVIQIIDLEYVILINAINIFTIGI